MYIRVQCSWKSTDMILAEMTIWRRAGMVGGAGVVGRAGLMGRAGVVGRTGLVGGAGLVGETGMVGGGSQHLFSPV